MDNAVFSFFSETKDSATEPFKRPASPPRFSVNKGSNKLRLCLLRSTCNRKAAEAKIVRAEWIQNGSLPAKCKGIKELAMASKSAASSHSCHRFQAGHRTSRGFKITSFPGL